MPTAQDWNLVLMNLVLLAKWPSKHSVVLGQHAVLVVPAGSTYSSGHIFGCNNPLWQQTALGRLVQAFLVCYFSVWRVISRCARGCVGGGNVRVATVVVGYLMYIIFVGNKSSDRCSTFRVPT
jgi:hypothetical protein